MASRLFRYIYSDNVLPLKYFKKQPAGMAKTRHIGYYGQQILLQDDDKLPLIGQIDKTKYQGLTILENNLYRAPACYHKPKSTDFLCVVHRTKNGERLMYLREIKQVYTVGQIEPKDEVYAPQSRSYSAFLKRRVQAFALRILEHCNNRINFNELRRYFTIFNEQVLRKTLKEIDVEIDRNQDAFLAHDESIEDKIKNLITPENICQYESAEFGMRRLNKLGIRRITNANKISFAANKFYSEETNQVIKKYAKIVEEEVLCTPWNLANSFITNQQTNGMMILKDIGDPSKGNGGYSYLKLPLKTSQDSLNKEVVVNKSVTGTEADLRKLSKEKIHEMLRNFGYDKQMDITSLSRWDGVKILRDHSSKAASLGVAGNFKKFARGARMTSRMQRENYQSQIDEIFDHQLDNITSENPEIPSDSDIETVSNVEEKDLKNMMKGNKETGIKEKSEPSRSALFDGDNLNDMKTYLETDEDRDVQNIQEVPGYNNEFRHNLIEYYDKFKEGSHQCVVLKKVIRSIDPESDQEKVRVVYIFDDKHIKNFKKRIEKCKSRRRTKSKKPANRDLYPASKSRADGAMVSLRIPGGSDYDGASISGGYTDNRISINPRDISGHGKISIPLADGDESKLYGTDNGDDDYGRIVLDTREGDRRKEAQRKAKKIKKPANNEDQYLNPPKKANMSSRRRQNTPLSQFNEILVNIIDSCITFDNTRLFHQPVKKADVPTYYDLIKNPIDLSGIKSKAKRCEYKTVEEFQSDFKLMKDNSEAFNGPTHFVTIQAVNIIERCELLVQSDMFQLKDLESKVDDEPEE